MMFDHMDDEGGGGGGGFEGFCPHCIILSAAAQVIAQTRHIAQAAFDLEKGTGIRDKDVDAFTRRVWARALAQAAGDMIETAGDDDERARLLIECDLAIIAGAGDGPVMPLGQFDKYSTERPVVRQAIADAKAKLQPLRESAEKLRKGMGDVD